MPHISYKTNWCPNTYEWTWLHRRNFQNCGTSGREVISTCKNKPKNGVTFFRLKFCFRKIWVWRSVRFTCANSEFRGNLLSFLLVLIFVNMDDVTVCFLSLLLFYSHSGHIWNGLINKDKSIIFQKSSC